MLTTKAAKDEFTTLFRGSAAIAKSISDAHDSLRDEEIGDCIDTLAQADQDCRTLAHQIEMLRQGLGAE